MSRKTTISTITIILALLILAGIQGVALADLRPGLAKSTVTKDKIILEYEFAAPTVSKMEKYDLLQIEGLELYERVGAPIVPMRTVMVSVPYGKQVAGTQVEVVESESLPGSYHLPPGQEPYPLSYEGTVERTKPDPTIYRKAKSWPGIHREEVGTQSKRGYQLFFVNLFPVQYIPSTGDVSYAKKMRLEVKLVDTINQPILRSTPELTESLKRKVDNPTVIENMAEPDIVTKSLRSGTPLDDPNCAYYAAGDSPYIYVVITNETLASDTDDYNFQALCDEKADRGISSCIVTTTWIYANYSGTDNQTKIRNFLIDAYQEWGTEYVLLGGNRTIIPPRMFWVQAFPGDTTTMPVDMYYGCVDPAECTFNYDQDGYYGERTDGVSGGDVDLCAEIYVGRAAITTSSQLNNFVRKSLAYKSTDAEYLPRVSMLGEHLEFGGVSEYAKDSMEQIRLGGTYDGYTAVGFEDVGTYTTEGCLTEDPNDCWPLYDKDQTWSKYDLLNLMNGGTHIFNHLGHSYETYNMKLSTSDLSSLTNTDYFFVYSQGCLPGAFDTNNCFAEVITRGDYGAFAVIMNARYGWGTQNSTDGPSQRFNRPFWDAVLGGGVREMGKANQDSKEYNIGQINSSCMRWCYYELNLFGDPELTFHFCKVKNITQSLYYNSIQEAIDDATNGDVIEVSPGTYEEAIDFEGKAITVRSTDPYNWDVVESTIIDTGGLGVRFFDGEGADSVLTGFTIVGGETTGSIGVYCVGSTPTVSNCIIRDTDTGILLMSSGSPTIIHCIIRDNDAYGICVTNGTSHSVIENCLIYDNNSSGSPYGAGIKQYAYGSLTVTNCTLVSNGSRGISIDSSATDTITNCILWDNGDDLYSCSATYSCIEDGDAGTGNISSDPDFVDVAEGDYHLDPNSPCIDTGDPSGDYTEQYDMDGFKRALGSNVDMGAYEYKGVFNTNTQTWYSTIQSAVDAAVTGDIIELHPKTYSGNGNRDIDFGGKAITLKSIDPSDSRVVESTVIDCQAIESDRHRGIYFHSGEDANSILDGIAIMNAMAPYDTVSGYYPGAAVFCDNTSSPTVRNCMMKNNIDLDPSSDGAAIVCYNGSDAIIENCVMTNNASALSIVGAWNSCPVVRSCVVSDNTDTAAPISCRENANGMVENCIIQNNEATNDSGGISIYDSDVTITNCTVTNNTADSGGGLSFDGNSNVIVQNCLIADNVVNYSGGGISSDSSNVSFENCTIVNNTASLYAAGGGVLNAHGSVLDFVNCIFWGNTAGSGNQIKNVNASATFSYCDIQDSGGSAGWDTTLGTDDGNNIDAAPCFIDAANRDYHLLLSSPCINTGSNAAVSAGDRDIDNDDRVFDGTVDMGADEYGRVKNITQQKQYWFINDAIDEAENGDEIVVDPDTYEEAINFDGKAITVRSMNPDDWDVVANTIIDATGESVGVAFRNGEGADSILTGFTVMEGSSWGIECGFAGTNPIISRCIVRDNPIGILVVGNGSATISHCIIQDNTSDGIFVNYGTCDPVVENCLIYNNSGGIHHYTSGSLTVTNCTLVSNGSYGVSVGSATETITNCILWDNNDDLVGCSATYSCIEDGDAGTGNISSDPCFIDTENDDYHLAAGSPCIDAGDPDGGYAGQTDIDNDLRVYNRVDIGADETSGVYNETQKKWYLSIQEAIDDAAVDANEVIIVYPGTYEQIDFLGKAITVRSTDPNDWDVVANTIIDAAGKNAAVIFENGEEANSILTGFTVLRASNGIKCYGSVTPTISNCIVRDSSTGIECYGNGSATITHCIIRDNSSYCIYTTHGTCHLVIENCLIYDNGEGVFHSTSGSLIVTNCTLVSNGSYGIATGYGATDTITNCILWDNDDDLVSCSATYSCIEDGDDSGINGNICIDPNFVDGYHLSAGSPCIDAGDNSAVNWDYDIDGDDRILDGDDDQTAIVDMGTDEVN